MDALYDRIGINYAALRQPDPRIASAIMRALVGARRILNIGAGAGSYEPADRDVVAVEPSSEMIAKRPASAAPAIQASAESLPFAADSFDAAMAIFTIHHWQDRRRGLAELRRVTRGPIVLLTSDPTSRPWLTDYLPELITLDERVMPGMADLADCLGPIDVTPVMVPHDCSDGFLHAYWRRPAAYLDARIRSGSSAFWLITDAEVGLAALADDLRTGAWHRRHGQLLEQPVYDAGYRLVVSPGLQ